MNEETVSDHAESAIGSLAQIHAEIPGAQATSPMQFPAKAWWAILKRVWVMNGFHNLALLAAGVAFYAFLAFVPLIASVVLLYGLIGDPQAVAASMDLVADFVPAEVATLLRGQLLSIVTTSTGVKGLGLALAMFVAVFGAMRSSSAMMKALNVIYEENESRGFFALYIRSAQITMGMVGIGIVGIAAISFFGYIEIVLTNYMGKGALTLIKLATWGGAAALVSLTFAIFYRFAPDRRRAKWRWLSMGSLIATTLWVGATFGFGLYAANLTDYNATYGSLAAVVIFQMWLFLSAYAVLIGAEFNAETERQTAQDSTVGSDRPIGQRGAYVADNIALDEASMAILHKQERRRAERAMRKAGGMKTLRKAGRKLKSTTGR